MLSVGNIIVDAYRMTGMLSDGQPLDGTQSLTGESLLNSLVGQLNTDGFFASTMVQLEMDITNPQLSYTIGTQDDPSWAVPDYSAQRPSHIRRIYYRYNAQSVPIEIHIVGPQDIYSFRMATGSIGAPQYACYLPNYPYGEIQFNIKPAAGSGFVVVYNKAIPKVVFTDNLMLPPEYETALKYGLAYVLAVRNGRPPEVIASVKVLRDEAYKYVQDNILVNTPLVHHLNYLGSDNPTNIYMFGGMGPVGY